MMCVVVHVVMTTIDLSTLGLGRAGPWTRTRDIRKSTVPSNPCVRWVLFQANKQRHTPRILDQRLYPTELLLTQAGVSNVGKNLSSRRAESSYAILDNMANSAGASRIQ